MRLDKTQAQLEDEYYVMDLLDVLDALDRRRAQEALAELNTAIMSQTTDAEAFRRYADLLQRQAGFGGGEKAEFDEDSFERARRQLASGRG